MRGAEVRGVCGGQEEGFGTLFLSAPHRIVWMSLRGAGQLAAVFAGSASIYACAASVCPGASIYACTAPVCGGRHSMCAAPCPLRSLGLHPPPFSSLIQLTSPIPHPPLLPLPRPSSLPALFPPGIASDSSGHCSGQCSRPAVASSESQPEP
eukprot:3264328-Rhodomonas_salina.1